MKDNPDAMYCWAPEIRYDAARKDFIIYWSTALKSEQQPDSTGKLRHYARTYVTRTNDFTSFSRVELFFHPGHSQIDASILYDQRKYYLFYKYSYKGISYAESEKVDGPWQDIQTLITNDDWEGVWPVKIGEYFMIYSDKFKSATRMGAWRSKDLTYWKNVSDRMFFRYHTFMDQC